MKSPTTTNVRHALILAALLATTAVHPATAAETASQRDTTIIIEPQSLATALQAFSMQSGLQVGFESQLAESIQTQGTKGTQTPAEALSALLRGTGLEYRFVNDQTVVIREKSSRHKTAASTDTQALRLAQADTQSESSEGKTATGSTGSNDSASEASREATDSKLEEIVVTAEKRAESIQSLPIAISAYSGETLSKVGISGFEALPQLASSLQVWEHPNAVRVSVRGVSNELGDPGVDVARDDVPYAFAHLFPGDFFDVDRIEVLRGPQGTISGRNATAGAIKIFSNRPSEELVGSIKATLGNYDRWGVEGVLSGPIAGDRLLGRLAVRTDQAADGWLIHRLPDSTQKVGTIDKTHARGSLLARLTENFEAHLILEVIRDQSNHLNGYYIDEGRLRPDTPTLTEVEGVSALDWDNKTIQLDAPNHNDKEQYEAKLRLNWDLGPSTQLTAVTGYVEQDRLWVADDDGTSLPLSTIPDLSKFTRQVSQEVTMTADLTDRLDVIVGALYLDSDVSQDTSIAFGAPPSTNIFIDTIDNLSSWAGYTQWRYRLADNIRLTTGVRYTHDSKDHRQVLFLDDTLLVQGSGSQNDSWDAWTPRFSVDYTASDDLTLYATVSRGFKAGGVTVQESFEPEFVWNYEVGVKANWLDGRIRSALAGFYMDYTDLQQVLVIFDSNLGTFRGVISNAESATNAGVELELTAQLTDQFRVDFSGTWLDATYDELQQPDPLFPELGAPLPVAPSGPNFRDLSGNRLTRSAEWQFNVSGEYRVPMRFGDRDWEGALRASYAWQDKVFFDHFNRESASQDAFGLLNLYGAIEPTDGRWQLSVFAHNLTDEYYAGHVGMVQGLASVPYSLAYGGTPRRYGVSFAYRF